MNPSNRSYLSDTAIFHFHDYGRKSIILTKEFFTEIVKLHHDRFWPTKMKHTLWISENFTAKSLLAFGATNRYPPRTAPSPVAYTGSNWGRTIYLRIPGLQEAIRQLLVTSTFLMGRVVLGPRKVYRNCCKRTCDLALAHGESLVQPFAGCEICGNLNIIQNSEADRDEYRIMTYLLVKLQFPISINPSTFQFAACRVDLARMVWSFHLGKLALQINTLMTMHTPCIFHNIITYYCSILLVICLLQIVLTALLGATAFVLLSGCLCMSLYILLPCGGSGFQWFLESSLSGPESQEEDQNHRGGIPNLTCASRVRLDGVLQITVSQASEDFEPHVCPSIINPTKTTLYYTTIHLS